MLGMTAKGKPTINVRFVGVYCWERKYEINKSSYSIGRNKRSAFTATKTF